jgi:formylglycine-generating enzyme required for sulfatase activity/serine/threonine protein kinase
MTEETNALRGGYQLHEYCIESVLGTGGFGITYKARDTHLETWVAIKEYFPVEWSYRTSNGVNVGSNSQGQALLPEVKTSGYDWGLDRFLEEARVLARVQHPYVVRVRRYFRANGTAYIVMDYEEGEPLSALLKRERVLAEEDLRGMLEEVLPALEAVHREGYLHRDIKPSNLYIRSRDGCVMLIDFGAARQSLNQRSKSITGLVTPGYSPPEQYLTRSDRYGPWTDIYALGAVLYRCVTGTPPTEAPDRQMWDTLEPAIKAGGDRYGKDLLEAIDRALAMVPKERFQSIGEMRDVLAQSAHSAAPSEQPKGSLIRPAPQAAAQPMAPLEIIDTPLSEPPPSRKVSSPNPSSEGFQSVSLLQSLRSTSSHAPSKPNESSSEFVSVPLGKPRQTQSGLAHASHEEGISQPLENASPVSVIVLESPASSNSDPWSERPSVSEGSSQAIGRHKDKKSRFRPETLRNIYLSLVLLGLLGILGTLVFNIYYEYWLSFDIARRQQFEQQAETTRQTAQQQTQQAQQQAQRRQLDKYLDAARTAMTEQAWDTAQQHLQAAASLKINTRKVEAIRKELADLRRQVMPLQFLEEPFIGMKLVGLKGECFSLGSPDSQAERYFNEKPKRVCVEDFSISQYEITNAQYRQFKPDHDSGSYLNKANRSFSLNDDQQPAVEVTWQNAVAFADWLSKRTGKHYRLPTEAEWEYAARAKTTTPRYWGDASIEACRYANVTDQTAQSDWSAEIIHNCEDGYAVTAPVGSLAPNKYQLYDMLGNVSEWTCSKYQSDYDREATECTEQNAKTERRTVRGGSWDDIPRMVRVSDRDGRHPGLRENDLGFRLVLDNSPERS